MLPRLIFLLTFVSGSAVAHVGPGQTWRLDEAVVVSSSAPPLASGIVAAWATVRLNTGSGSNTSAHVRWLSMDQALPTTGVQCSAVLKWDEVDGVLADRTIRAGRRGWRAKSLVCDGQEFAHG